jgi:hypothetical protein
MVEFEVSELIGAELGERRPDDRATHGNGYRPRRWNTRADEVELQIPKLRQGSYFPSFLEPAPAICVPARSTRDQRRVPAVSAAAGGRAWRQLRVEVQPRIDGQALSCVGPTRPRQRASCRHRSRERPWRRIRSWRSCSTARTARSCARRAGGSGPSAMCIDHHPYSRR